MTPPTEAQLYREFAERAFAAGRGDVAGECLRRAAHAEMMPTLTDRPETLDAAGVRLLNEGKLTEAERLFRAAVGQAPGIAALHDHLGVALAMQKKYADAEGTFRAAIRLDANYLSAWRNLIHACFDRKKFAGAEEAARRALELEPNHRDTLIQLAVALGEQGKFDEAITMLQGLIRSDPTRAGDYHYRLGVVLGNAGRYPEAENEFRTLLKLNPNMAAGWSNLAAALGKQNRWSDAAEAGKRAVALDPNHASAWGNLGNALRDLGQLEEAEAAIRQALALEPLIGDALGNLALVHAMRGEVNEAIAYYDRSLAQRPDSGEVRFNRAIAYLSLGDFARGWPEYEWRHRTEQMKGHAPNYPSPVWDGRQSLQGKTLLLYTEQGAGDSIQFIRLIERVHAAGGRAILATTNELRNLLKTYSSSVPIVVPNDPLPAHDFHSSLMTLPLHFRIDLATIPNRVPYLFVEEAKAESWRERLAPVVGKRIGIVWQGNPKHIGDRWRSVPASRFRDWNLPGVSLISLQKGFGAEQLQEWPVGTIVDAGSQLADDFSDTAALISQLDLVITVDTSVAHLAGALSKPVWILLPLNADWRWLQTRDDSPWYPTAKLFRQRKFRDWDEVFRRVRSAIAESS